MRPFDFVFLRFGVAMGLSSGPSSVVRELDSIERGPPGVGLRGRALAFAAVAITAAPLAQAQAVGAAERSERQRQHDGVADHRLEVELAVDDRILVLAGVRALREQLLHLDPELALERREAASAGLVEQARQRPR